MGRRQIRTYSFSNRTFFTNCMENRSVSPFLISLAALDSFPPGEAIALRASAPNSNMSVCLLKPITLIGICRGERTPRTTLSFRTSSQTGVGISIEFQAAHRHTGVLTCHFPKFIHEKWCFYPGDCHTSDIGHWFAMTGKSTNSNLSMNEPDKHETDTLFLKRSHHHGRTAEHSYRAPPGCGF